MSSNPFARLADVPAPKAAAKASDKPKFSSVVPVPDGAPAAPKRHPQLGVPAATWTYLDGGRRLLGYTCRFNKPDGRKEFRPLVVCTSDKGAGLAWRWQSWDGLAPLYGLDRLAERPGAPVVLCEGEKSADAAGKLLPGHVTIASAGGSKRAGHADWAPLRGRHVTVWPDPDEPGAAYAAAAAERLYAAGAASVLVVMLPELASEQVEDGWDAADALEEGWSQERATALVAGARPAARPAAPAPAAAFPEPAAPSAEASTEDGGKRGPGRPSMQDTLLAIAEEFELWHTPKKDAYASILMPTGHRENWRLRSDAFARYLRLRAHEASARIPSKSNLEEVVGLLEARAIAYGPQRKEWLRVGRQDGKFYLDLGCTRWRAVEVGPREVRILDSHSLPFVRPEGLQPLPEPEFASDNSLPEMLAPFVNVGTETDLHLIIAWTLAALCASDEFPLLVLNGEQGTGKSTLTRLLRSIVDPHAASILSPPKEDRDLFVLAQHTHVVAFDNLSKVEGWMSDCLCMLATGGQMASRSMYTDANLTILDATRPVILNGIPALAERPDLADRSVTVRLRPVPAGERRTSADIKRDWEAVLPRVLGAFLEAMSTGLRRMAEVRLANPPRMAWFANFMVAAAPGLGLDGDALLAAYRTMLSELSSTAFGNNPVALAVVAMMDDLPGGEWTGTPTELLEVLSDPKWAKEEVRRSYAWPKTAQALGTALTRIAPALRDRGIDARSRHSGKTVWDLRKLT
ncbi:hypothetical protein [Methylobacterium segetis]|uniref:hypothetical protein n=1 Tax=Methylobacterium segetis TaxID=2488750 RepID=UPI00104684AD|nr:hypothetical protein [Methylobacterium segetis]